MIVCTGTETWRAWCVCGWLSPVVADARTARQAGDHHQRECEEVTARP